MTRKQRERKKKGEGREGREKRERKAGRGKKEREGRARGRGGFWGLDTTFKGIHSHWPIFFSKSQPLIDCSAMNPFWTDPLMKSMPK